MKSFKAGQYISQGYYKSFQPQPINIEWKVDSMELLQLLSKADRQLGRLDMYSEYIPNIDFFIRMHVLKEATMSSKIEGTQTKIEEALLDKEDVAKERREDWVEVQNYIDALNEATELLNNLPLSSRLIKRMHKILMQGVRGEKKTPGEFRTSQNWIGGASINDAVFVPPVHTSINDLMSDLEKFAHNGDYYLPPLLKIALIHYQFETIHPFLDGNGRVGRLMIPVFLVEQEILKKPILYLSDFFERQRSLYYDNLTRVREKDDLVQWLKFFLVGIIETAKIGIETFDKLLKLQNDVGIKIQNSGITFANAQKLLNELYQRPVITPKRAMGVLNVSDPTVYKLLNDFEKLDILKEVSGAKRGKIYMFDTYVNLFR